MHSRPSAPDASQHGPHDTSIHRRRGDGNRDGRAGGGGADRGHVPRGVAQGARPPLPARPPSPTAWQGHPGPAVRCTPPPGTPPRHPTLPGTLPALPCWPPPGLPAMAWGTAEARPTPSQEPSVSAPTGKPSVAPSLHPSCTLPAPFLHPSCTPACTLPVPFLHPKSGPTRAPTVHPTHRAKRTTCSQSYR